MALLYLSSFSDCGIEGTWGRANPLQSVNAFFLSNLL
jgi:hypothetical protein